MFLYRPNEANRPAQPPDRKAVIDWYKEVQYSKGAGLDIRSKKPAKWFHGKNTYRISQM